MQDLMELASGDRFNNGTLKDKYEDSKKADEVLNIMSKWLANEKHIFTRQHILRLLVPFSKSYPKKSWSKSAVKFGQAIMETQWREMKPGFNVIVTPALISVYKVVSYHIIILYVNTQIRIFCNMKI